MNETWSSWLTNRLVERGLFPEQAAEVLDLIKKDEITDAMAHRWNDPVEEYPPQMKIVVWMSASSIALKWIDTNCPNAWYRCLFSGENNE